MDRLTINEVWDGHCWLELGGLIADISLKRTVQFGNVPLGFRTYIVDALGAGSGMIAASPEAFENKELIYTPCFSLSTQQVNGLINGLVNK